MIRLALSIYFVYFATMLLHWGWSWKLVQYLVLGCLLLALSLIDLATYQLPDQLVLAVALTALFRVPVEGISALVDGLIGALAIGVPLLLFVLLADYMVGRETMGGGDIKLLTALGFHFGAAQMLVLLILSCCIGIAFSLTQKFCKYGSPKKEMPFGPSIALATWATSLLGYGLINWYWENLLC